jgi:hypothetical protein
MESNITIKSEPKAKIILTKGSAFAYPTANHLPKLHQCMILNGKRGSGKSVAATNLLRMYKQTGTMQRILILSPTFNSNYKLMEDLDININDVFDPEDPDVIQKITAVVEGERDDYIKYITLKENFKIFMKSLKGKKPIDFLNNDEIDDSFLDYYDSESDSFKIPKPKYKCYDESPSRPPILSMLIDDCMCTKLFNDRKFPSMVIRHRHLGALPTGGAVGLSLFICIQSYKASSGLPKVIRNQSTSICLFRTKDRSELKQISESFSGEIDPEKFEILYNYATQESPHDFLFVDLHSKKEQESMFRKNFDQYIIYNSENNEVVKI